MLYSEIGLIPEVPATFDEEGKELTPAIYKEGWHVNTLEIIPEWAEYHKETPANPYRVYAGGVLPVCYTFPSEAVFKSLLPEEEEVI